MYPDIIKGLAALAPAMLLAASSAGALDLTEGALPGDGAASQAGALSVQSLPDPTRPLPLMRRAIEQGAKDSPDPAAAPEDAGAKGPVLSAVMTSPVRGAVINGNFVKEGAMAGEIKLESVSGDSAVLLMPDGRKVTMRLFESSLKISR